MTDRIDHAAEAAAYLAHANDRLQELVLGYDEGSRMFNAMIAEAQVHATLALVEQQRIANVIALRVPQAMPDGGEVWVSSFDADGRLLPEIREGLGLE